MKPTLRIVWATGWLWLGCLCSPWAQAAEALGHAEAVSGDDAPVEAEAEEPPETRFSASLETWLYATRILLTGNNLLNAGNRLAKIPGMQMASDTRMNITAERGPLSLLIQPRFLIERDDAGPQTDAAIRADVSAFRKSADLTQFNTKLKLGDHTLVLGRELSTWGPGNFRSPSNPFYYDSGRTSPLASTPGIDLIRYTYKLGDVRINLSKVFSTNQITPTIDMGNSRLLKLDYQGENYLLSVNAVQRPGYANFVGAFAQYSPDDAWMLFGEFGTAKPVSGNVDLPRIGQVIKRAQDGLAQFGLFQQPAKAAASSTLGAAYTLESGHVVSAEWLHNAGGLNQAQQERYFRQIELARAVPNALTQVPAPFNQLPGLNQLPAAGRTISDGLVGVTLAQSPPLLGRDYLWFSVQSNAQDTKKYWRAEWSQSMADHSGRLLIYAEKSFKPKLSAFVAVSATTGGARSDFGSFVKGTLTLGFKVFAF
jgi:hypothetical protein